jgi:glycosyltransferase involved in cell wall biosynthesis
MTLRILILGNINSTFILNYVKELKAKMNCEIDIFTEPIRSQEKEYVKQFIKYFDNIYEISKYTNEILSRIPKIRGILQIKNMAKQIDNLGIYDICHIHYLNIEYGYLYKQIINRCKKLVISIWGSDFYRSKWWEKKIQYRVIKYAHEITFTTKQMSEEFGKYFKKIDKDKLKARSFGLVILGILREIENISKKDYKKSFNLSTDNIIVTCGNNAAKGNEHIKIIKSIKIVKHKLPDNILFLFPFTYGLNRKYFLEVKGLLDKSNLNYRILTDYLSDYEVAQLRKLSDIMIHLPISDQLSGSMQENLYTRNIVITGDWLPYKILEEKGIFMLKVSSMDEVGEKLLYSVNNLKNLKESCKGNSQIIWNLSSWDKNIDGWIQVYQKLLQS